MDLNFVLLANDSLARTHEEAHGLGRLDFEHDRHVALVNQLDRRLGPVSRHGLEADVGDGVERDELAPVFCLLRRRAKGGLSSRHYL